jgi:hypothetical protein
MDEQAGLNNINKEEEMRELKELEEKRDAEKKKQEE